MKVGDIIKNYRNETGMSMEAFGKLAGLSKGYISMLEKGENPRSGKPLAPSLETIKQIASTMRMDVNDLLAMLDGDQALTVNAHLKRKAVTINVLGRVAAGVPIEAVENIIDTEEITQQMALTGDFFGLQIKGDSMEPRICEGDVVIIRQQNDAESGDIVIAIVNGCDATCKKLLKYADGIRLMPTNPAYEPMYFTNEEIENKPVKIIGKVVENRQKY